MATSPEGIKHWLRVSRRLERTGYGYFGEYLYAVTMSADRAVESCHSQGFDFLIDGTIRVDVKTRICLDSKTSAYRRVADNSRRAGVTYPHVVFYDDMTVIYDTESNVDRVIANLPWECVSAMAVNYMKPKHRRLYIPMDNEKAEQNKEVLRQLAAWIKEHWRLEAKTVRRSSPSAMAAMNRAGWGPEAFYLYRRDIKSGKQLVVLVYFDGEADYDVCAYPARLSNEIKWKDKTVGDNPHHRMTFDQSNLPAKFRFENIDHFKNDFLIRFPRDKGYFETK
jgi:hypothetical protein